MKSTKLGFTLVEVSLFLAITALLFFGVTLGVRGSISQQRYNDSVQSFAEFLRSEYSEVANVEHTGTGTSEQAIYGKLLSFGETYDLAGNNIGLVDNKVFSYTVIGDVGDGCANEPSGGTVCPDGVLGILQNLNVRITTSDNKLAGISQEYSPKWGAEIQNTKVYNGGYELFEGSVLIVRHPETGMIHTFFNEGKTEVNFAIKGGFEIPSLPLVDADGNSSLWKAQEIDFCVNPLGRAETNMRRDVRIAKNARNASGVEIINQDGADNRCK